MVETRQQTAGDPNDPNNGQRQVADRQAAIASRSGYRSKLTRVKRIIAKFEGDETLLDMSTALSEIEHNLGLIPALRDNLEKTTERIIQLTEDPNEKAQEHQNLQPNLDEVDAQEDKLIRLRAKARSSETRGESAVQSMFDYINKRLDEQQIQLEVDRRLTEERFQASLNSLNHSFMSSSPKTKDVPSEIKLKELHVPEFSGKYTEWIAFKELFLAIIDKNSSLTDTHKLYYLISLLKGEAKSVVEHIPISGTNYPVAWNLLLDRYDNKMGIATGHIKTFLSTSKMTDPNPDAVRRAQITMSSSVQALKAMDMYNLDIWLIYQALEKFDTETKTLWARKTYKTVPTWSEFDEFLSERYKTMEIANAGKPTIVKKPEMKPKPSNKPVPNLTAHLASTSSANSQRDSSNATPAHQCVVCKGTHRTVKCYNFRGMTDTQRYEIAQKANLCYNCLYPGHSVDKCQSSSCRNCGEKHSTWLHAHFHPESVSPSNLTTTEETPSPVPSTSTEQLRSFLGQCNTTNKATIGTSMLPNVLLATAVVCIQNAKGEKLLCRAILDSGSQANIVTERVCQLLKLPKKQSNCRLEGIGAQDSHTKFQTVLEFGPQNAKSMIQTNCFIQSKITGLHPSVKLTFPISIPPELVLAYPQWNTPQTIDILIGGRHYWDLVLDNTIRLGPGQPILKESVFGWMVVGEVSPGQAKCLKAYLTTLESIDSTLRRFWEIEEFTGPKQQRKEDDELAEKIYQQTTSRLSNGQFMLHLPFNDRIKDLEPNLGNAKRQLYYLMKTMSETPGMADMFLDVFKEYEQLNIIERVPQSELNKKCYYLPYHGILKESSTTTKLRIVYNASSKSKSKLSLNDTLLIGPVIQPPLINNLWGFRRYPYAAMGDVTKMYLQFLVIPKHRDFLRFLRKNSITGEIEHWRFRTLVFGVASSPFLAVRSMKQTVIEDGDKFPAAKEAAEKSFYVDDCLISAKSVEELSEIKEQLTSLLQCSGLTLCKWSSNVPELCGEPTIRDVSDKGVNSEPLKALGLSWNPNTDQFSFKVSSDIKVHPTKKQVLSVIARIFDPLGLLGPVVMNAKRILQTLWKLQCDWDVQLPDEVVNEWEKFINSLDSMDKLTVPRCISEFSHVTRWEVHLFTDASIKAYGAAVYIVTEDSSQNRNAWLLTAKSRVAPVKIATIPKLEMSAAELGSRMVKAVMDTYHCQDYYCWCDARVVIDQIQAPEKREVFVRNQVKIILENTSADKWQYVRSADNPADIISRGASADQLRLSTQWWNGPDWLLKPRSEWPTDEPEDEALRVMALTVHWITPREYLLYKSNSFDYIRRVMAWILRFVSNFTQKYGHGTKSPSTLRTGPLQPDEILKAEVTLVKLEQLEHLSGDIKILKGEVKKKVVSKRLRMLGAFLDSDGVMRVGGRLRNAALKESTNHPILFPGGILAKHFLYYLHHRLGHAGPTHMLSAARERYWPLVSKRSLQRPTRSSGQ
ncbi:Aspartic peptidase domain superfamily [Sergentomyia squamirostris]